MSTRNNLIARLTDVLQLEARALGQLQQAMEQNREVFVTIRANSLDQGIEGLEPQWQVIEQLESKREGLLQELGEAMQIHGKLRVSRLVSELPPHLGRRLRDAADHADSAARRVRAETAASARLLRLSQKVHDEVIRALTGCGDSAHTGYDKTARTIGGRTNGGRLVLGTV